jgi:hypothetical protein
MVWFYCTAVTLLFHIVSTPAEVFITQWNVHFYSLVDST